MKHLTQPFPKLALLALLAGIALLFTGCATSRMWDSTKAHHYQPFAAVPPQVLHDPATDSFLVVCPQYCHTGTHDSHNRRAGYWLYPAGGPRPDNPAPGKARLQPLTVYVRHPQVAESPRPEPLHGVYHPDQQLLLIHRPDGTTITNALASVHVKADPVGKVLLLPLAVGADAAMVGGVAVVGAAEVAVHGASSYYPQPYYYPPCQNDRAPGSATVALVRRIADK